MHLLTALLFQLSCVQRPSRVQHEKTRSVPKHSRMVRVVRRAPAAAVLKQPYEGTVKGDCQDREDASQKPTRCGTLCFPAHGRLLTAVLLQLSLRNCCRCFCYIHLSYPPRRLSNTSIQRGPQRVQNSSTMAGFTVLLFRGKHDMLSSKAFLWLAEWITRKHRSTECDLWNKLP